MSHDQLDRAGAFEPRHITSTSPARPGYEIWFATIFDRASRTALWLRYTLYVPNDRANAQALLWLAYFDAERPEHHAFHAQSYSIAQAKIAPDSIQIEGATLSADGATGSSRTPHGNLAYELQFQHRFEPHYHGPPGLARSGLVGVSSTVLSPFCAVTGRIKTGRNRSVRLDAEHCRGTFVHISGKERTPELYWTFAPFLQEGRNGGGETGIEAVYVKPPGFAPAACFGSLLYEGRVIHDRALTRGLFGRNRFDYPEQRFRLNFEGMRAELRSQLRREQSTGYIYRGPSGTPYFIVQSDVSSCDLKLRVPDGRERRFHSDLAAVEFHGPKAWPGVMYMDPYE